MASTEHHTRAPSRRFLDCQQALAQSDKTAAEYCPGCVYVEVNSPCMYGHNVAVNCSLSEQCDLAALVYGAI